MTVAEQALDGMNIHTGFQKMRGEAVAQGVDATLTTQPRLVSRHALHALCHLVIYRLTT